MAHHDNSFSMKSLCRGRWKDTDQPDHANMSIHEAFIVGWTDGSGEAPGKSAIQDKVLRGFPN